MRYVVVFAVITLFALAPIISMLIASGIANANGCMLDEGSAHPCVIGGTDWADTLYTMFVLCWLMFATLPLGALAFLGCLIALFVHRRRWKRKQLARAAG